MEIESGKKNYRPQPLAVIAAARQANGMLPIAKTDWLARNAGFIFTLRNTGVEMTDLKIP